MNRAAEFLDFLDQRGKELEREWRKDIQFIIWFIEDPCDAPFLVYVELLKEPLGDFFLSLFSLDAQEVAQSFIEPGDVGSCRGRSPRGRTGLRGRFRLGGNPAYWAPDPNEWIARGLQRATGFETPFTGYGSRFFFRLVNIVEGARYNLFFYDALKDLGYNWLSAVTATKFCQASINARCRMFEATYSTFPFSGEETLPMLGNKVAYGDCRLSFSDGIFRSQSFNVIASMVFNTSSDDPKDYEIRLEYYANGETIIMDEFSFTASKSQPVPVVLRGTSPGPGVFALKWVNAGDFASMTGFTVYAQGTDEPPITMVPSRSE